MCVVCAHVRMPCVCVRVDSVGERGRVQGVGHPRRPWPLALQLQPSALPPPGACATRGRPIILPVFPLGVIFIRALPRFACSVRNGAGSEAQTLSGRCDLGKA